MNIPKKDWGLCGLIQKTGVTKMKNMNIIILLVLLITITGSISGYCQNEYYYDYDKYVKVEYYCGRQAPSPAPSLIFIQPFIIFIYFN